MDTQNLSSRKFAHLLDVNDANTVNYINCGFKLSSDLLEKPVQTLKSISPIGLLTGKDEQFLPGIASIGQSTTSNAHKRKGTIRNSSGNHNVVNNHLTLHNCRRDLESSLREVEQLKALPAAKDDLIAAKEEMLSLLRAGHNRPN